MSAAHRRMVLKPSGLSKEDATRLREQLAAAAETQRQLAAASPHVLTPLSNWKEDDSSFYLEHEPADTMEPGKLFGGGTESPGDAEELLRLAAALADALRVAHGRRSPRPAVHGGLCGRVVLESPDGIVKIGDFGVAPAICSVLGVESYLNLAIAEEVEQSDEVRVTGIWEVVSADDYERNDRICGFIDPDKYGRNTLATFESGSDIVAAGFILHLRAEHRHPYLNDLDHLKNPELSEWMAAQPLTDARRKDLRESTDPRIQRWCEVVRKMLAYLPTDRPSAESVADQLIQVGVKPAGAETMLEAQLKALDDLVKKGEWDQVRAKAQGVLANEAATPEIETEAKRFVGLADANAWVVQAEELLRGEQWQTAREPLDKLKTLAALPKGLDEKAGALRLVLQRTNEAHELIRECDAAAGDTGDEDPQHVKNAFERLLDRLDKLAEDGLADSLRRQRGDVRERLIQRIQTLEADAAELEADHNLVSQWFNGLNSAYDARQWSQVEAMLKDRPSTPHWPRAVKDDCQRLEERFASLMAGRAWVADVRRAADNDDLVESKRLFDHEPASGDWPPELRDELTELKNRFDTARAIAEDHAKAQEWITALGAVVQAEDWTRAGTELSRKPTLAHWPVEIAEQEKGYREEIEARLQAQEKLQLWLQSADEAASREEFERALQILDRPPPGGDALPSRFLKQRDERAGAYQAKLEQQRRETLERQQRCVEELATGYVYELVAAKLSKFMAPELAETSVDQVEWESIESPDRGQARIRWSIRGVVDSADHAGPFATFAFELDTKPPRIRDEEGTLSDQLVAGLKATLVGAQTNRAADMSGTLRKGLFPDAEIVLSLDGLADHAQASCRLLGSDDTEAAIDLEMKWNPASVEWTMADGEGFAKRAIAVVTDAARQAIQTQYLDRQTMLQQYASLLSLEVHTTAKIDPSALQLPLPLRAELKIKLNNQESSHLLQSVSFTSPSVGKIDLAIGLDPAVDALRKTIAEAQRASRDNITTELRTKLQDAPLKVKMVATPARLAEPVDEIQINLKCKRRDPLDLAAAWKIESFLFEPVGPWDEGLARLLAPLAPGESRGRGVAMPAGVAAVAVAVLAGTAHLMRGNANESASTGNTVVEQVATSKEKGGDTGLVAAGDSERTDTGASNADPIARTAGESDRTIVQPPPPPAGAPSLDAAKRQVETILAKSPHLAGIVGQGNLVQALHNPPRMLYAVPGFSGRKTVLLESTSNDELQLTSDQENEVVQSVADLNALLSLSEDTDLADQITARVAAVIEATKYDAYITRSAIRVSITPNPSWALVDGGWRAENVDADVELAVPDEAPIQLATIRLNLEAVDGAVRIITSDGELSESVAQPLHDELLSRQTETLKTLASSVEDNRLAVTQQQFADLATQVTLTAKADRLQPRTFAANWDNRQLRFRFAASFDEDVAQVAMARDVLASLNRQLSASAADHWVRSGTSEDVVEFSEPSDGDWMLGVPSPWDQARLLPLTVGADDLQSGDDPKQVAQRLLQDGLSKPEYWSLVERYVSLSRGPVYLSKTAELAAFGAAVPGLSQFQDGAKPPAFVLPRVELIGAGGLSGVEDPVAASAGSSSGEPTLELTVGVRFGVPERDDLGDSMTPAMLRYLDDSLASRFREAWQDGRIPQCTLTLTTNDADPLSPVQLSWSAMDGIAAGCVAIADEAREVDRLLSALPQRIGLENALAGQFPESAQTVGQSISVTQADTYSILQDIWLAKGASASRVAKTRGKSKTLEAFSLDRQKELKTNQSFPKSRLVKRPRIDATVFVEFFRGPTQTYALAWSVKVPGTDGNTIPEGPFLTFLGFNEALAVGANGIPAQLGAKLLDPILDRVPTAVEPKFDSLQSSIGLVLAFDEGMPSNDADWGGLALRQREAFLFPPESESDREPEDKVWRSLGELRDGPGTRFKCDYLLMPTLAANRRVPVSAAQQWAMTTIDQARRSSP